MKVVGVTNQQLYLLLSAKGKKTDIKQGSWVKVVNIKKAASSPNHARLIRKMQRENGGRLLVIKLRPSYAELARSDIDALLGTVRVPVEYLKKV